jgi:acid phosphatase (class A)
LFVFIITENREKEKRMIRSAWVVIGIVISSGILSGSAYAAEGMTKYPVTQIYLPEDSVNVAHAISPPPARASAEDKKDSDELYRFQERRTKKECARAATEARISLESFFGPKYGPLTEAEVQAWTPFFKTLTSDSDYYVQKVKEFYKRPRPYLEDSKLSPCISKEGTLAYPSGHAAISRVFALTLGLIDPPRKNAFDKRAEQIGRDRVLGGVHHPTDIIAGDILGDEIFKAFTHSDKFMKDLAALPKP